MGQKSKNFFLTLLASSSLIYNISAQANNSITLFNKHDSNIDITKIEKLVQSQFDSSQYRNIKVQVIYNAQHQADHALVYLFSKKYHRVDVARINIDNQFHKISVLKNYSLNANDFAQQPRIKTSLAKCPDNTIQFISFAPNDNEFELSIANGVADAAEAHGLKTIRLMNQNATSENYMNYMKCPRLKGNFYDGDANPEFITTADGIIFYTDINNELLNQFAYKVTNIWLACEAYNDPIKTSILETAQTQKYAAGINDLFIGPSDRTAACAMKAALDNKPMTAAFQECYAKLDTPADQWGFGGNGSDYFGG